MDTKKKPTTIASLVKLLSMRPHLPLNIRMGQNFHLVQLDGSIDEINNDDYGNSFTDVDECIDFITDINEEKTFMIVSGTLCQTIVPIIQDISQVSSVYISCGNKAQQWPKVKGIYTGITSICEAFKQAAQDCD